jgi:pimeloyl-ACP methyl ester carboxylesterase
VSTDITMDADAVVLHEIVQVVRLIGYQQVNSVGHSYGSGIAMREASAYRDVNRLVLTGYLHAGRNPVVAAATYPAIQDPLFAGRRISDDYSRCRSKRFRSPGRVLFRVGGAGLDRFRQSAQGPGE